jgi:hypothetical protein
LVEATEYIQIADELEFLDALARLKVEIGNGFVGIKWEDQKDSEDGPDPNYLAKSQLLPIGPGFARDAGAQREPYRPLLVRTSDLQMVWPSPTARTKVSTPLHVHKRAGRGSARQLIWTTLSRMQSEQWSMNQPHIKLVKEVLRRNGKKFEDSGWNDRTVLRHVSKWLAENGYGPKGNKNPLK